MSSNKKRSDDQDTSSIYSPKLISILNTMNIPDRIHLKSAGEFDDKFIYTTEEQWAYYYSGSRRYILFTRDEITKK